MKKMMKAAVCSLTLIASLGLGMIAEAGSIPTNRVPLHTYAVRKVTCYVSPGGAAKGWIDPGDYVIVTQIRGDGWAYGSYPVKNGRTSRWFKANDLVYNVGFTNKENRSPQEKINVFRDTSYRSVLGSIWGKEPITVVSNAGDSRQFIYKISGGYKMGWASAKYVDPPILPSRSISLNVGSLKQKDPRWANVYVYNKTIGKIGCLITSLTMKYNYQNKTNITPATMKNKLKFQNKTNNLLWSSVTSLGYTTNFAYNRLNNASMGVIYTQLKNGKPVIVGAKKKNGDQHWIVVKGYNGSTSGNYSVVNFSINDPDYSYTNLQQFINTYPYALCGIIY